MPRRPAAVPSGPDKSPHIRYIHFTGYKHQINDEGRLFDVRSIQLASQVRDSGYDMELFFPAELMRGFNGKSNHIMGFCGIWADTDKSGRETELRWPVATSRSYWRDCSTFGELVLMSKEGLGFTFRIANSNITRGDACQLKICVSAANASKKLGGDFLIKVMDNAGKVVKQWTIPLLLTKKLAWWEMDLDTTGLAGGSYK
mgnify:CR=1 FL=1